MSTHQPNRHAFILALSLFSMSALPAQAAERTLHAFDSQPAWGSPPAGTYPLGTMLRDSSGALYGATWFGGAYGNGAIFKLSPPSAGQTAWKMSLLYSFTGGTHGSTPNPVLAMDSSGSIYGTTQFGGSHQCGCGVAFKLTPPAAGYTQWQATVLHTFNYSWVYNLPDGAHPSGGLIIDRYGSLYGTTAFGGVTNDPDAVGFGTVFKLTPLNSAKTAWQETVLYRFQSVYDGKIPQAALRLDAGGTLYGTTREGGHGPCLDVWSKFIGCGTVFKLAPPLYGYTAWTKSTLHNFVHGADGVTPEGRLVLDSAGAIYGATFLGGTGACKDLGGNLIGCGTVYRLSPPAYGGNTWTETILYSFTGTDGAYPQGGLTMDAMGTLYGTTSGGGRLDIFGRGDGVVFKLSLTRGWPYWSESVLHYFAFSNSGQLPLGELVRDSSGRLFGVTNIGGPKGAGTVYEITP